MPIGSLESLQKNPTFEILAKTQAILDDACPILSQSPMTRSPFQLLAFPLMWILAEEQSKPQIIRQLNAMLVAQGIPPITEKGMDTLTTEIDWKSLTHELNDSSPDFLQLYLPSRVLDALKTYNSRPESTHSLSEIIDKIKMAPANTITIISTISQTLKWFVPFSDYRQVLHIPRNACALSEGLLNKLAYIKTQMHSHDVSEPTALGCFQIVARKLTKQVKIKSDMPLPDEYRISLITHNEDCEFKAEFPKTDINTGLYAAFENVRLQNDFIVEKIKVQLAGNSYLNKDGAGVQQEQTIKEESYFCEGITQFQEQSFFLFDITVNSVYALFKSMIAVNYPRFGMGEAVSSAKVAPDIFISLIGVPSYIDNSELSYAQMRRRGMDIPTHLVKLYPKPLSNCAVMDTMYAPPNSNVTILHESKMEESKLEVPPETQLLGTPNVDTRTAPKGPNAFFSQQGTSAGKADREEISCANCCTLL